MVIRPRTKLVRQRKLIRCPKCNAVVRMRKTCKRCGKRQRA
jgi:primosomal protein N'